MLEIFGLVLLENIVVIAAVIVAYHIYIKKIK